MKIEFKGETFTFFGSTIGSIQIIKGVSEVDNEVIKLLVTNDYFNSLIENSQVVLLEELSGEPSKEAAAKKRKPAIDFTEEP